MTAARPDRAAPSPAGITGALRGLDLPDVGYWTVHTAVRDTLVRANAGYRADVPIASSARIPFLTDDGIGIDVRTDGHPDVVYGQLVRWATSPAVTRLMLVTTLPRHCVLQAFAGDVQLHTVWLRGTQ